VDAAPLTNNIALPGEGNNMRTILYLLLVATPALAQETGITRLSSVSFTVADFAKARQFYKDILGLEEVFDLKHSDGTIQTAFFKINDEQYLEFSSGNIENFRLDRVTFLTSDQSPVATALVPVVSSLGKRGIKPGPIAKSAEGNMYLAIRDPDRTEIRFIRQLPGSLHAEHRGKGLSDKRISSHLHHVALAADNEAASMGLFCDALGFKEFSRGGPKPDDVRWINLAVPGTSSDLVELMVMASLPPPARQHIGFEVADMQQTYKELVARGLTDRNKPFPAAIGRWIWFIRDPNNIRIEFMGQPTEKPESK
jgi:catechol 2,3-dioxygenase-like lactoylglutathione lyase family enzyme